MIVVICITRAVESDCEALACVANSVFSMDSKINGPLPDGVADPEAHKSYIQMSNYYKILNNGELVGGLCLIKEAPKHVEVGIIFLEPEMQDQGIGRDVLCVMEEVYSNITQWTLDTGYQDYRNQHFYEKLDYNRVGTTEPEENGYYKILYQKIID